MEQKDINQKFIEIFDGVKDALNEIIDKVEELAEVSDRNLYINGVRENINNIGKTIYSLYRELEKDEYFANNPEEKEI